jgi:hypothetical protein
VATTHLNATHVQNRVKTGDRRKSELEIIANQFKLKDIDLTNIRYIKYKIAATEKQIDNINATIERPLLFLRCRK